MQGQAVVVTGGAGFIGTHVCAALARRGARAIALDNFDPFYPRQRKEIMLAAARRAGRIDLVEADICDDGAVRRALQSAGPGAWVIHLAARAGVRPSLADPAGYARTNVHGTSVVMAEAARAGVARLVIASSSSVYGNCPAAPFAETMNVDEPISPYAATKRACEILAFTHHRLTGMPTACLRFFTVFGPGQRPDLAIEAFLSRMARGEALPVFGDGSMQRDYTYIDDIVSGVLASCERIATHGYRVWNLGSDRPVSLSDMIATLERVSGRRAVVDRRPTPPGDVERTWADLTRSRAELDYAPSTAFEDGVRKQWQVISAAAR